MIEHELKSLKISELEFDGENPNEMSEKELSALRESMKKFGFLTPVIVDQNFIVADGEHRILIYKEFEKETIPGFVVNCIPAERKLIRQAMNKVRGSHNPLLDAEEIRKILDAGLSEELETIALIGQRQAEEMIKLLGEPDARIVDLDKPLSELLMMSFSVTFEQKQKIENAITKSGESDRGAALSKICSSYDNAVNK